MQIVCTTTDAAAAVLLLLFIAELRPSHDFAMRPTHAITPPITFTMLVSLTVVQLKKIRAITNTLIIL